MMYLVMFIFLFTSLSHAMDLDETHTHEGHHHNDILVTVQSCNWILIDSRTLLMALIIHR